MITFKLNNIILETCNTSRTNFTAYLKDKYMFVVYYTG